MRKSGFEVFDLSWDEEHNLYGFEVQESNGKDRRSRVHWDLVASVEYRHLSQIRQEIQEMAPPPYTLVEKGKNVTIDHEEGLLQELKKITNVNPAKAGPNAKSISKHKIWQPNPFRVDHHQD